MKVAGLSGLQVWREHAKLQTTARCRVRLRTLGPITFDAYTPESLSFYPCNLSTSILIHTYGHLQASLSAKIKSHLKPFSMLSRGIDP